MVVYKKHDECSLTADEFSSRLEAKYQELCKLEELAPDWFKSTIAFVKGVIGKDSHEFADSHELSLYHGQFVYSDSLNGIRLECADRFDDFLIKIFPEFFNQ